MKARAMRCLPQLIVVALLALGYSVVRGQTGTYHGFDAGYCTYYAAREFDKLAGEPKESGWRWRGDAGGWLKNAANAGYKTTTDPQKGQKGAIAVWSGGGFGHVAIVTRSAAGSLTISEMNWGPNIDKSGKTDNFGKVTTATLRLSAMTRGDKVKYAFQGYIFPTSVPARFTLHVLGTKGKRYTVLIRAEDEEITREHDYDGARPEDKIASGHYVAFVKSETRSSPIRQGIQLFGRSTQGEFNLSRNYVNTVPSGTPGSPDVLFVEQWFSSNGNDLRLFFVDMEVLKPIAFVIKGSSPYYTERSWPLKRKGPLEFATAAYFSGNGFTVRTRWRFEPELARFICMKRETLEGIVHDY